MSWLRRKGATKTSSAWWATTCAVWMRLWASREKKLTLSNWAARYSTRTDSPIYMLFDRPNGSLSKCNFALRIFCSCHMLSIPMYINIKLNRLKRSDTNPVGSRFISGLSVKCDVVKFSSVMGWNARSLVASWSDGKSTCWNHLKKSFKVRAAEKERPLFEACMFLLVRTQRAECWEVAGQNMFGS